MEPLRPQHRPNLVISTGAKRSGETCISTSSVRDARPPASIPRATPVPFVISTGAKRSGEICSSTSLVRDERPAASTPLDDPSPLCRLDRSVPEFPTSQHSTAATHATLRQERRRNSIGVTTLNRKSGVAQWRDLQFNLVGVGRTSGSVHTPSHPTPLCHLDRSEAQWRDLQFNLVGAGRTSGSVHTPSHPSPPCHLDRSEAQWRDLQFYLVGARDARPAASTPPATSLPFVISTGAKRSGEICSSTSSVRDERWAASTPPATSLPFVISTGAKRSGEICSSTSSVRGTNVGQRPRPQLLPHSPLSSRPERSAVERSAVLPRRCGTNVRQRPTPPATALPLCHLDRSEAQWRDLQFYLVGAGRTSGSVCPPSHYPNLVIPTGAYRAVEGPAVLPPRQSNRYSNPAISLAGSLIASPVTCNRDASPM